MYCCLSYGLNWTVADVFSDIVAVLTGETTVGDLSASLDDANSEIVTTYQSAGWTLHDDVSATKKVIKSPIFDDANQYKYLEIYTSSDRVLCVHWRDWNATTHTGTDSASLSTVSYFSYATNEVSETQKIYISASNRHILGIKDISGVFVTVYNVGLFEYRRASPWDTAANAASEEYINTIMCNSMLLNTTASGSIENPATLRGYDLLRVTEQVPVLIFPNGDNSAGLNALIGSEWSNSKMFKDDLTTETYVLYPFGVAYPSLRNLGGEITSLCDVWYMSPGYGNHLDDFERSNGNDYKLWIIDSSHVCMAVPYG